MVEPLLAGVTQQLHLCWIVPLSWRILLPALCVAGWFSFALVMTWHGASVYDVMQNKKLLKVTEVPVALFLWTICISAWHLLCSSDTMHSDTYSFIHLVTLVHFTLMYCILYDNKYPSAAILHPGLVLMIRVQGSSSSKPHTILNTILGSEERFLIDYYLLIIINDFHCIQEPQKPTATPPCSLLPLDATASSAVPLFQCKDVPSWNWAEVFQENETDVEAFSFLVHRKWEYYRDPEAAMVEIPAGWTGGCGSQLHCGQSVPVHQPHQYPGWSYVFITCCVKNNA